MARHPSSRKWSKWPYSLDVEAIAASDGYRDFIRSWHQDRAKRPMPVYREELDDAMTPTIGDVRKAYRALLATNDDLGCLLVYLSKRVRALEDRMPKYKGIWSADESYPESSLVTSQGSLWISTVQSKGIKPGDGNCWQLAAKKGRDGRHCAKDTT